MFATLGVLMILFAVVLLSVGSYMLLRLLPRTDVVLPAVVGVAAVNYGGGLLKTFNIDSCATIHVCNNPEWFETLEFRNIGVTVVSSENAMARGIGTVMFTPSTTEGRAVPIRLGDVYYMPDQPFNLLSVSRLEDAGFGMNTTDRPRQMTYKDMACNFYKHEGVYPWS